MIHAIESAPTLTQAAQLLNISQPALTGRLQDAEKLLGLSLFERRGRTLSLTRAGELLLPTARHVLGELSRIENEVRNLSGHATKRLRIGMPQYASYSWLPMAVKVFALQFPAVDLEIASEAATDPRSALSRGEIDVALVSSPAQRLRMDDDEFESRLLLRDEFVALLPAAHPKAGLPFLEAQDFREETYITNSAVPERNREYELFFQPNAVRPERVVQVGFTEPIIQLVAANIGVTIITRWILKSADRFDGVVNRPLTGSGLFVNWFAVYKKHSERDIWLEALFGLIAADGAL